MRVTLVGVYLGLLLLSWGVTEEGFEEALGDPHLLILLWGAGWFAGAHLGYRLSTQGSRGRRRAYVLTVLLTLTALTLLRGTPTLHLAGYLLETTAVAVGLSLLVGTASRGTHNYTVKEAIARGLVASGATSLAGGALLALAKLNEAQSAAGLALTVAVVALLLAVSERDSLIPPAFLDALDELSTAVAGMRVPQAGSLTLVVMLAVASSYLRLWTRYVCDCGSPLLYALGGLVFSLGAITSMCVDRLRSNLIILLIIMISWLKLEACVGYLSLSMITGYYSGLGYKTAHLTNPMRISEYSIKASMGVIIITILSITNFYHLNLFRILIILIILIEIICIIKYLSTSIYK